MSNISYSKVGIADMIRSMEGSSFASALEINLGYYHIKIDADVQKLCKIVLPWYMGKYKHKRILPVPKFFQKVMSKLVQVMEYVETYLFILIIC
jgi:hypothetical protein